MATLTIHTDINCDIYVDTELYGTSIADKGLTIELEYGPYWIDCKCSDNPSISYNCDVNIVDECTTINIPLLREYRLSILKSEYDYVSDVVNGIAKLYKNGEIAGFVDNSYQYLYDEIELIQEEIWRVQKNNLWGVIDSETKEIIPIKYSSAVSLGEGVLRLELNDRFCLYSIQGRKLTSVKYHKIEYAFNGTYALFFDRWEFINSMGSAVSTPDNILLYATSNGNTINFNRKIAGNTYINSDSVFDQRPIIECCIQGECIAIFKYAIKKLGPRAFAGCNNLLSITIPSSAQSIDFSAFAGCNRLSCITIPGNVVTIGAYAFGDCKGLKTVLIHDGVATIKDSAFVRCKNLESIVLPDSITSIGGHVFEDCINLSSINIPNRITEIADYSFHNCERLTSIKISNNTFQIRDRAFEFCSNLESIECPATLISVGVAAFAECKSLKLVSMPNVEEIGGGAFHGCTSLTKALIGNRVQLLSGGIFYNCSNLIYAPIPKSVKRIGSAAFYNCINLTEAIIPDNVTHIGDYAFSNCQQISTVIIGDNVTQIERHAFIGCENLSCLTIGKNVNVIEDFAFHNCNSLQNVIIPNSVNSIGQDAFSGCQKLSTVVIGTGTTNIEHSAFYGCNNLSKVYCKASIPPQANNYKGYWQAFTNNAPDRKIFVKQESLDSYKYDYLWGDYNGAIVGYAFSIDY